MRLRPAEPNAGICFVRTDQSRPIRIPARVEAVTKRARRTSLQNGSVSIETVEHCLSACAGLGVDNIDIELTGNELPAVDGSCLPFVRLIEEAVICEQDVERQVYVIEDVVRVVDGDMELVALPPLSPDADTLEIFYDLNYGDDSPIGRQIYAFRVEANDFVEQIAPARTFVLQREAEALQSAGLGTHLTYQDIVVYGENGPIDNQLRFPDECVRHKILDLIGDLMLAGKFVVGRIHAKRSGHAMNHALARAFRDRIARNEMRIYAAEPPRLDIHRIQRILPHRYPLLMLDRIVELDGTDRAVAIKNVTINEQFFQGHYPGQPIMPGVLILEAMAQLGGVLLSQELEQKGRVAVLLSLDKVKFRRAVTPGDQLLLEAQKIRARGNTGHVATVAKVAGEIAAQAEIKFMLTDAETND